MVRKTDAPETPVYLCRLCGQPIYWISFQSRWVHMYVQPSHLARPKRPDDIEPTLRYVGEL